MRDIVYLASPLVLVLRPCRHLHPCHPCPTQESRGYINANTSRGTATWSHLMCGGTDIVSTFSCLALTGSPSAPWPPGYRGGSHTYMHGRQHGTRLHALIRKGVLFVHKCIVLGLYRCLYIHVIKVCICSYQGSWAFWHTRAARLSAVSHYAR